jgi:hypothetical protein
LEEFGSPAELLPTQQLVPVDSSVVASAPAATCGAATNEAGIDALSLSSLYLKLWSETVVVGEIPFIERPPGAFTPGDADLKKIFAAGRRWA